MKSFTLPISPGGWPRPSRYFDMLGHRIASELDDRIIGLTLDEIKEGELVVGSGGGKDQQNIKLFKVR